MINRPWDGVDADSKETWTAYHNYEILYQDLLVSSTKCHCCHDILRDSERRHRSMVPARQDLHVSMKIEFNEDNIGVNGELDICVRFHDNDQFADVGYTIEKHPPPDLFEGRQGEHPRSGHCHSHMVPVTGQFLANNTGSEYTAGFVKKCLEHCRSHHRSCRPESIGAPWYPTRLVEVLEEDTFRVIETRETVPTGPYATLSHCWGTSRMITATTQNIGRLKKQIPLLDLPKTFSDALQFIKSIGISFIWIDSLCIIQDSVKDWESESRTMLQVYRHAECNLAAASSKDSHGGLFSERNYAILPSGWFEMDNNIPEVKGTWCAVPTFYFKHEFDKQIGSSRLMSRGWVFQERAASRRVIAFGQDQVFWDCSELLESDVLPSHRITLYHHSDENRGSGYDVMGMAVPKILSPGVPKSFRSLGKGLVAWPFIVQRYSACAFTFNKDNAVAILGVAQMMSNALKVQPTAVSTAYWAGLWLQDMYRQLAWRVTRAGLRKNSDAPSWSWLSIHGPVEWTSPSDLDPESSWCKVSALATVISSDTETMQSNSSFRNLSCDLKIWCNLYLLRITEPLVDVSFAPGKPYTPFVYLDHEDIGTERLHFLPLTYNEKGNYAGDGRFVGILVQPVDNRPGVYRRCGSAKLMPSRPTPKPKRVFNKFRSKQHTTDRRILRLLGKISSPVDFAYEGYNTRMGYLIRVI